MKKLPRRVPLEPEETGGARRDCERPRRGGGGREQTVVVTAPAGRPDSSTSPRSPAAATKLRRDRK